MQSEAAIGSSNADETRAVQLTEAEQIVTMSSLDDTARQHQGSALGRICQRVMAKIRNALPRRRASLVLIGRRDVRHEDELVL